MQYKGVNPYMPFWETVPDGEPRLFNGRVYVYGSHDRHRGSSFCMEDYVCWSAPADDLTDWRCDGVIYSKLQDPINGAPYAKTMPKLSVPMGSPEQPHYLYAPDVVQGPDSRYYLYYGLDFVNVLSVAVADQPEGPYEFLDFIRYPDGTVPQEGRQFDPGVLVEDGRVYLYYGFCPDEKFFDLLGKTYEGAMMVELEADMHTVKTKPVCVANGVDTAAGSSFAAHPFFEASSIRKIGERYYFVYSSLQGHELCYGVADSPQGPFSYAGVLVSNADLGYEGNVLPTQYLGNNHGGILVLPDAFYIFYHRHTQGTQFSRQACAEELRMDEAGFFPQVEMTSSGLYGTALPAEGAISAYIACHLTEKDRSQMGPVLLSRPGEDMPELPKERPYYTDEAAEEGERKFFVANLRPGSQAGFKYFDFDGSSKQLTLELRGKGSLVVRADSPNGSVLAASQFDSSAWTKNITMIDLSVGRHSLYFECADGELDFAGFEFL